MFGIWRLKNCDLPAYAGRFGYWCLEFGNSSCYARESSASVNGLSLVKFSAHRTQIEW